MNPRQMHYETLAGTIIKNLARRRMEGYYCATVEDAEKMAFSFLTPGCTVSFGGSMTLEDTGMLTATIRESHCSTAPRQKRRRRQKRSITMLFLPIFIL